MSTSQPPVKRGRWDSSEDDDEDEDASRSKPTSSKSKGKGTVSTGSINGVSKVSAISSSNSYIISNKKISEKPSNCNKNNNGNSNSSISDGINGIKTSAGDTKNDTYSSVSGSIHTADQDPENHQQSSKEEDTKSPLFYGCRSVDEYQRLSFIDQGTYGAVFRAKCLNTGKTMALKQVKIDKNAAYVGFPIAALREINILMALSHPHIIRVVEMVVGSEIDKVYMVMDYYDNDLKYCMSQKKHPFSLGDVKQLMLQLLSAIEHMHSKWYIHRDLKTSNILYSNTGKLCVCDFGLARKYSSPIAPYTHEVVSLYYRAPEVLLGCEVYSTPLDMWGVACIFAELITGEVLFQGEGEVDQINKIYRRLGVPNGDVWPDFSKLSGSSKSIQYKIGKRESLKELFPSTSFSGNPYLNESGFDLLSKMLVYDPLQRLVASEALGHRWLQGELPNPTNISDMPKFPSRHEETEDKSLI